MKKLNDEITRLIREELEKQGLSQAEFARRVGVSQKHLSMVLQGKGGTTLSTLDYWAFDLGKRWSVRLVNA